MGVIKVPNSKRDLQGIFVELRLVTDWRTDWQTDSIASIASRGKYTLTVDVRLIQLSNDTHIRAPFSQKSVNSIAMDTRLIMKYQQFTPRVH